MRREPEKVAGLSESSGAMSAAEQSPERGRPPRAPTRVHRSLASVGRAGSLASESPATLAAPPCFRASVVNSLPWEARV